MYTRLEFDALHGPRNARADALPAYETMCAVPYGDIRGLLVHKTPHTILLSQWLESLCLFGSQGPQYNRITVGGGARRYDSCSALPFTIHCWTHHT